MYQCKVTVIMAVYNAESYLRRCLDSIQAQTLTDFDVILVDDGSTDKSLAISKEYASKDNRFRVYHKENGGPSSARQYGIERLAEKGGKYSIHVDPDDWVEPKMLERLYAKAEETRADMVICDFFQNTKARQCLRRQNPKGEEPNQVLNALFLGLQGSLWNKLTRTACYKEARIKFPEGLNYCEDFYVNVCLLLQSIKKVAYLPEAYYHYDNYSNSGAETRKRGRRHIDYTRTEIVKRCRDIVPEKLKGRSFKLFEMTKAFNIIMYGSMPDKDFKEFFHDISPVLLLYPHRRYIRTLVTVFTIHTHINKKAVGDFCQKFQSLSIVLKNLLKIV